MLKEIKRLEARREPDGIHQSEWVLPSDVTIMRRVNDLIDGFNELVKVVKKLEKKSPL